MPIIKNNKRVLSIYKGTKEIKNVYRQGNSVHNGFYFTIDICNEESIIERHLIFNFYEGYTWDDFINDDVYNINNIFIRVGRLIYCNGRPVVLETNYEDIDNEIINKTKYKAVVIV